VDDVRRQPENTALNGVKEGQRFGIDEWGATLVIQSITSNIEW
jgi:hypothetical protein